MQSSLKPASLSSYPRRRVAGYTFIEALMMLGILSVLMAIAVPVYRQASMKAKRAEASIALSQVATQQQQFYVGCQRFAEAFGPEDACSTATMLGKGVSATGLYELSTRPVDGGFEVVARAFPHKSQGRDTNCAELTLTITSGNFDREPKSCF